MNSKFAVIRVDSGALTSGLATVVGFEIELRVSNGALIDACCNLARFLAQYVLDAKSKLRPGDTIDWASSLLKVRQIAEDRCALDEFDFDGVTLEQTVDKAVRIWSAQSEICTTYHVPLVPTRYGDMIALAPGVLDGGPVEGIRYPARAPISGWWLFTPEYDGEADEFASMKPTHVFHLLRSRPDVAAVLGLPTGFAFRWNGDRPVDSNLPAFDVWFEDAVANQPIP